MHNNAKRNHFYRSWLNGESTLIGIGENQIAQLGYYSHPLRAFFTAHYARLDLKLSFWLHNLPHQVMDILLQQYTELVL